MREGFVYLDEAVEGVFWDAKYAGEDNFTGGPVDGYLVNRIVLTGEAARGLTAARDRAAREGYRLLVWDAYRPQRAVDCFMRWCAAREDGRTKEKHYPRLERGQLVPLGYIAEKSGHSRGSTVDLTLADAAGRPVDMGGDFDLMDESSHHGFGGLTERQQKNRKLLRSVMLWSGFRDYENEWWHYILRDEPYPRTYFDFPIE